MNFRDLLEHDGDRENEPAAPHFAGAMNSGDWNCGVAALQIPRRARARSKRGDHVKSPCPRSTAAAFAFSILPLLLISSHANAQNIVNLTWNASASQVVGYNVYRGGTPRGPYTKLNSALVVPTNYADNTAQSGQTYYYVTTAVNSDNTESAYSNQTEAVVPKGGSGSENVLYSFTGSSGDPKLPYAGLVFDKAGNLYGTTEFGGTSNQGSVFEVIPNSNGQWTESVLYSFTGNADGGQPSGGLIFDAAGNLYGTTDFGGSTNCAQGCGTTFKLSPGSGGWKETVLYSFTGGADGREPASRLIFDSAGNLYGTTLLGGNVGTTCSSGCGAVFELTPASGGTWKESVLYAFSGAPDGAQPYDGLIFDSAGNLYGTASAGGASANGVIFKLTPTSGGTWTESVLHSFTGGYGGYGGKYPYGDLIVDAAGNLYGTAYQGGAPQGYGVVFELLTSRGKWTEKVIHVFGNTPSANPVAGLVMDATGNLYGTTMLGANQTSCGGGCGTLFKLVPSSSGWTYRVVHSFGLGTDGFHPSGDLILDAAGNLYGTTQAGGANGAGMVFQIMH